MDRFQAMQLFTRIVDAGSFSKAADQLGISRASASAIIRRLEEHLGGRLLQRTTRRVSLTLDGRSYYQHCQQILAAIEEAEGVLSQRAQHPRGKLRVDVPVSLGRLLLIPRLPEFHARYPEVALELGAGDRMIDLVHEGVDCVIRIGALEDSTLVARALPSLPQVTCISATYAERHGLPRNMKDLGGHRCVDYISSTSGRLQPLDFLINGKLEAVTLPAVLAVNNGESYVAACEAGLGLIQVPYYHVAERLAAGSLLEILQAYRPPPLPMTVLYPHHQHLTPRLRVFIDWLVLMFEEESRS